ncbi:MAG: SCP2 sterol-binding domain-containing protein [Alphaproteobacteria bacterium]|uniref:SCP2 sterol-binding domain-containing protein n=1 Tax=Candidatus Nitrobium versatile TaxID=2884831 RepID=A0A953JGN2_9BACT|nr:SCP2 sterol-binding domain-containing protein [Candidatus Nitrobium versatile]
MRNLEEHPAVKRFHEKNQKVAWPPAGQRLNAERVRQMCLDLGADDVGFVELGRPELDEQREEILKVLPSAKTLVSFVCRVSRENLRSPARSIANLEMHEVSKRVDTTACKICASLERTGVRAVTPAAGFPMEADKWLERMHVVAHKPVAVAAGLGAMGMHRNVIHPVFGVYILLGTVVIDAEVDGYSRPLDHTPCLGCKLCAAACPTGAIAPDGYYNPVNCLTHTYREAIGGFTDWVEIIANSKDSRAYRKKVSDAETVSLWQSLAAGTCYKSMYCMAVCPAGEDVMAQFIMDRKGYMDEVVRPLQEREETVYVLPGSDAESHVLRMFPHKKVKQVGNGIRPHSIKVFLRAVQLAFQRDKAEGLDATYHFTFTGEENEKATIIIRNKTVAVMNGHEGTADIRITADSKAWLRALHKDSTMFREIAFRRIRVTGPLRLFKAFGECFA